MCFVCGDGRVSEAFSAVPGFFCVFVFAVVAAFLMRPCNVFY